MRGKSPRGKARGIARSFSRPFRFLAASRAAGRRRARVHTTDRSTARTISQMRPEVGNGGGGRDRVNYTAAYGLSRIPASPLRVITRSYLHTRVPRPLSPGEISILHSCTHTPRIGGRARETPGQRPEKYEFLNAFVIVTRATRLLPTARGEKKEKKSADIIKERKRCVRRAGEKRRLTQNCRVATQLDLCGRTFLQINFLFGNELRIKKFLLSFILRKNIE